MPTNPETHCQACGEPLSTYGHCWQHHYPPMDPAQDAPAPSYEALAAAHSTRYGGRPVEADGICGTMVIGGELHVQAYRDCYLDWYEVKFLPGGQIDPTTIVKLPF